MHSTTLSSVLFIGSFDKVIIKYADFTGSKGEVINPSMLYEKNIESVNLCDTVVTGSFRNVKLKDTCFMGAKSKNSEYIKINLQKVLKKEIISCILKGVEFTGSFDCCSISNSSFEGSNGALIDPQTICDKDLTLVNLKDAIVIDDFEGVETCGMKYDEELLIDRDNMDNEECKKYCIGKIKESVRRNDTF